MNIKYSPIEKTPKDRYGYDRFVVATTPQGSFSIHYAEGYEIVTHHDEDELELYYTGIQVSPIKPYDLQEYAWARYTEDDSRVEVYRNGKKLFSKHIDDLQSFCNMDAYELTDFGEDNFDEFESLYDEWFTGVIEQIIILLQKENSKYNSIIDRT